MQERVNVTHTMKADRRTDGVRRVKHLEQLISPPGNSTLGNGLAYVTLFEYRPLPVAPGQLFQSLADVANVNETLSDFFVRLDVIPRCPSPKKRLARLVVNRQHLQRDEMGIA
ncbi:hypothetical protein DV737_g5690, partial [Chaetothyriales sp. CBS 132003]